MSPPKTVGTTNSSTNVIAVFPYALRKKTGDFDEKTKKALFFSHTA